MTTERGLRGGGGRGGFRFRHHQRRAARLGRRIGSLPASRDRASIGERRAMSRSRSGSEGESQARVAARRRRVWPSRGRTRTARERMNGGGAFSACPRSKARKKGRNERGTRSLGGSQVFSPLPEATRPCVLTLNAQQVQPYRPYRHLTYDLLAPFPFLPPLTTNGALRPPSLQVHDITAQITLNFCLRPTTHLPSKTRDNLFSLSTID